MKLPRFDHIGPGKRVSGLVGSSRALYLLQEHRPFVALSKTEEEAKRFSRDLAFFSRLLGQPPPLFLPPLEDKITPARLAAVEQISAEKTPPVTCSVEAALAPIWPASALRRASLTLREGAEMDPDFFTELLEEMGYRTTFLVADTGEYALRTGLLDLFPAAAEHPVRLRFTAGVISSIRLFDVDTQRSFRDLGEVRCLPVREPEGGSSLFTVLKEHASVTLGDLGEAGPSLPVPALVIDPSPVDKQADIQSLAGRGLTYRERREKGEGRAALVPRLADLASEFSLLLVSRSAVESDCIRNLLSPAGLEPRVVPPEEVVSADGRAVITEGQLSAGFIDSRAGVAIVPAKALFGSVAISAQGRRTSQLGHLVVSLDDLFPGDLVVHVDHGVGRYMGLKEMNGEGFQEDLLELEYAGGAKLFLPPGQIDRIRRHHGGGASSPSLDRLGGPSWPKAKERVEQKIREMAEGLLRIAAAREAAVGFPFSPDTEASREFVRAFPFEETPDQLRSMEEIRRDMESKRPMDRLLCGDVGYGKTEVAMRAAFKAVADKRQVALLVPTTLLAEQHFDNFSARFAPFPVQLDLLSRYRSPSEQRETLRSLADGSIDIIIGTQRLLGRDVTFPRLGLLIIDEEHKFGVADKEKIKGLKECIDVLTLTATPIPRTLHLALSDLRSLSLIESPPEERMAVKAIVAPFDEAVIKEAVERELDRGGQVFFVHNRIESIARRSSFLRELVPNCRIVIAHGRLGERETEEAMRRFHRREADLLLCTAIVGAGLDIPRANTVVIERADTFGLADLYQLKGRVGRSDIRAFAYFLTPPPGEMTPDAERRLETIGELSCLGSGFRLAMKDLELRGAGSILSADQSGNIDTVGYDLYLELLRRAVADLKGEARAEAPEPVVDVTLPSGLPGTYLDDTILRFTFHRKIASLRDTASLADLRRELLDRFGPLPQVTARLLDLAELKIIARAIGLRRLEERDRLFRFVFGELSPAGEEALFHLPGSTSEDLRFSSEKEFEVHFRHLSWEEIFKRIKALLALLEKPSAQSR